MKTISAAMQTHLNSDLVNLTTCVHITRTDGVELFFTEHDVDLTISGDLYTSALGFNKSATVNASQLSVDNLELDGFIDSVLITEADLRAGNYDYAEVLFFAVNWADLTDGVIKLRRGLIGEVILDDNGVFKTEMRGMVQLYSQNIGEVYSPECRADLGDTRCQVDTGALSITTTITTVTDIRNYIVSNDGGNVDGYFKYGVLTFNDGDNAGFSMEIQNSTAGSKNIQLYLSPPTLPVAGTSVTFYPGCPKTVAVCVSKFDNILNFRGEPYVPEPGVLISFPNSK
jgi:uncharacterized phage protein (TIGR02218 family)